MLAAASAAGAVAGKHHQQQQGQLQQQPTGSVHQLNLDSDAEGESSGSNGPFCQQQQQQQQAPEGDATSKLQQSSIAALPEQQQQQHHVAFLEVGSPIQQHPAFNSPLAAAMRGQTEEVSNTLVD
jgi:hypothetical protein